MSYDYKSKYKCKVFGIKKINRFFAVEETNLFGDFSKYDFIMNDCIVYDDCNGNVNFRVDVMKEACDEPNFNGWKLDNLYFYGNWSGQAPAYNLIDKFGDIYHSSQLTNKRKRYEQQPEVMIRETLLEVLNFT